MSCLVCVCVAFLVFRLVLVAQVLGRENARSKWDAWMRASTFSKEEAMARYVSVALSVVKSRGDDAIS